MYLILNYALQNLSIFPNGLFMSFFLTPKYSRIKSLIVFQLTYAFIFIFKMIYFSNATFLLILSIVSQAISYLYALIAFKDSVFKKILTSTCTIFFSLLAEYATLWLLPEIAPRLDNLTADNKYVFLYSSIGVCVQIILILIFIILWRYITHKKAPTVFLTLSLVPMFQITIFVTFLSPFFFGDNVARPIYIAIGILISLLSNLSLLYYFFRKHEKKTVEDAYEELQELYAMDLKYYEALEKQHEALAKIRHDYQNQLATLYMLISSNKIETAKDFIKSLNNTMKDTTN